jgi:tRNA G37 N-methylase Trm5
MPRKKTIKTVKYPKLEKQTENIPVKEEAPIKETKVVVEESEAKKQYRAFIEAYKEQHPVKYASKEPELLKKLNSL